MQVHPGGLACGGDHHEGLLQLDTACYSGLCRSLLGSALCPQGSPTVVRYCLHGGLYTVGEILYQKTICILLQINTNWLSLFFFGTSMTMFGSFLFQLSQ